MSIAWLGWLATAVFTCSYLVKKPSQLRLIQAAGAALWISYGLVIHAVPVVIANTLVAAGAVWATIRQRACV